MSCNPATSNCR